MHKQTITLWNPKPKVPDTSESEAIIPDIGDTIQTSRFGTIEISQKFRDIFEAKTRGFTQQAYVWDRPFLIVGKPPSPEDLTQKFIWAIIPKAIQN